MYATDICGILVSAADICGILSMPESFESFLFEPFHPSIHFNGGNGSK